MNVRDKIFDSTSSDRSLDVQLASSSRELLQEKVTFVEARRPDAQYEELKKLYKPLNNLPEEKLGVSSSIRERNAAESEVSGSGGVDGPRVDLFPSERVELLWKAPRRVGAGLANLGNTCFLNSVLQCLSYTPPLVNYLQSGDHTRQCRMVGFCAMCEIKQHIDVVLKASGKVVRPMGIVQRLKSIAKHFRVGRQEDAHEFLRYLVDGLQKSCLTGFSKLDTTSQGTSVVHRIFGGYHRSQVKCLKCRFESNTYEPLLDISLNIKSCLSVKRALEKFIEPEMLDGVNRYLCSKCHQKVPAQKRLTVHRAPNVLTLQMKRFEFHSLFGSKLSKEVRYDEKLDLRPYMSCRQGPPEMYQLYAVLVHAGSSCNSGHYYCFVRSPAGHWCCMNDAQVYQVSISTVLGQQAYLLFYVRMKPIHDHPVAAKTATVKPIQPLGTVSTTSQEFIGPVKPDTKSANPEAKKLLAPQTNQLNATASRTASTARTMSFTPRCLKTVSATDVHQQTAKPDNVGSSELKKKKSSVSLHNIQKPTAVVPPSPVVSPVPQPLKSQSERANSVEVTRQPVMLQLPVKSDATSATAELPGASLVEKKTKQKTRHDSKGALVLLSGYVSSDSDTTPSPARIAPATSTTSDGRPTSPDESQETQLMSHEGKKSKYSDEVPEGPQPPVDSSVREADQSTENQVDKSSGEIKARSPAKDKKKKKKKKHKKDKKTADKMKDESLKHGKDRYGKVEHAVTGSKHKRRHSSSSDSLHTGRSRKRQMSSDGSSTDVFHLPSKERLSSEERHYKHRHRHHSASSSDFSDRFSQHRKGWTRSYDGHHRSWSSDEDNDRHKQRRRDSVEQSERQKAKKVRHRHHSTSPASCSPEKHCTNRRFDRRPEKIRWEDTVKSREGYVPPSHAIQNGSQRSDVLSELTGSSLYGYGKSVQSWEGGQSHVDRMVDEDHRYRKRKRDIWDEEYDRGKVRKSKKHKTAIMRDNAFQRLQSVKHKLSMVWKKRCH